MVNSPNTWGLSIPEDNSAYVRNIDRGRPSVALYKYSDRCSMNSYNFTNVVIHHSTDKLYTEDQVKTSSLPLLPEVFGNVDFPFIDEEFE